jgi:hypothetical protein
MWWVERSIECTLTDSNVMRHRCNRRASQIMYHTLSIPRHLLSHSTVKSKSTSQRIKHHMQREWVAHTHTVRYLPKSLCCNTMGELLQLQPHNNNNNNKQNQKKHPSHHQHQHQHQHHQKQHSDCHCHLHLQVAQPMFIYCSTHLHRQHYRFRTSWPMFMYFSQPSC